ncbi:hypothetical protein QBC35DRAFT_475506 [Podospora australis]|uniref:Uncharacterized protein n=1 Tax=Podospora australis TaxID=1536484 RepID=A0AAN7AHZ3_9PEZI|nr:hypothetical protein QBC35DRAFT_475506 [Podospora australis]
MAKQMKKIAVVGLLALRNSFLLLRSELSSGGPSVFIGTPNLGNPPRNRPSSATSPHFRLPTHAACNGSRGNRKVQSADQSDHTSTGVAANPLAPVQPTVDDLTPPGRISSSSAKRTRRVAAFRCNIKAGSGMQSGFYGGADYFLWWTVKCRFGREGGSGGSPVGLLNFGTSQPSPRHGSESPLAPDFRKSAQTSHSTRHPWRSPARKPNAYP